MGVGYPFRSLNISQELTMHSNLTHYSYFGAFRSDVSNVGPNAAMLTQDGKLTDIGSWYMGGFSTNNVPKGLGGRTETVGLMGASALALFWALWL
jgi:hypothetical protein